ncbi:MAG: hypothetical protein JWQ25_706 [Daejeonella sp.]|nr:hypothetical protein [Daejeonella sp.]
MKLIGFYVMLFFVLSCAKDNAGRIPNVYLSYRISLQEFQIKSTNGLLLVKNEGVAGLIIYRRPAGDYVAFDRCSSVNPEQKCAVVPDDPSLTATDPCSGAKFSLDDGAPVKAPAKRSLKQYQVYQSTFELSVNN